jgi:hypothetical protein
MRHKVSVFVSGLDEILAFDSVKPERCPHTCTHWMLGRGNDLNHPPALIILVPPCPSVP